MKKKNMTYTQVMDYVEELKIYGSVPGLTNISNLCIRLGMPQEGLKFIHIAGTNGKGSVLSFLSQILKEAGYRVGRYISPTLFDYRERIQLNGRPISKKDLCRLMTELREICRELAAEGNPHPTAFEIETAMAFQYFKEKGCEIVVLETGLGGLEDATNIVSGTLLEVFTSISLDHMRILGSTLTEIAENKAGIMKPGSAVLAIRGEEAVMKVLEEKAKVLEIPLFITDPHKAMGVKSSLDRQSFSYKGYRNLVIKMAGLWQVENAMLAVDAVELLREKGFTIPDGAVRKGLEGAVWPGRFQVLAKKPWIIADGAHNRGGAGRLAQSIGFYFTNRRIIYIIGMLRDKEQEEVLSVTAPLAAQILTVPTRGERGLSAYDLACIARRFHNNVTAVDSVQEAVEMALLFADRETVIIAFGSLSYLGELIRITEKLSDKKSRDEIRRDSHGK